MSDKAKAKKAPLKERRESRAREIFLRLLKNKVAVVSACVLLLIILLAILAPVISPYKYDEMDLLSKNQGPSIQHLFGTDNMGRDILERVMYGGRYSLSISVIGVIGAILIGMLIGTAAGFFGGTVDNILMSSDTFLALFSELCKNSSLAFHKAMNPSLFGASAN